MPGIKGSELVTRVKKRCNIDVDGGRFDTADVLSVLNIAMTEVNWGLRLVTGRRSIPIVANDRTIDLSKDSSEDNLDILGVMRVTLDGKRMTRKDMIWLDTNHPDWDSATDTPTGEPTIYYPQDEGIGIYKKSDGNYTMKVFFVKLCDAIVNTDTSFPFNNITQNYKYHHILLPRATYLLMQEMPEKKLNTKNEQLAQYNIEMAKAKQEINLPDDADDLRFEIQHERPMQPGLDSPYDISPYLG